jgi:hypothetical protein
LGAPALLAAAEPRSEQVLRGRVGMLTLVADWGRAALAHRPP